MSGYWIAGMSLMEEEVCVVAGETPTRQAAETEPTAAPTFAPSAIPTLITEPTMAPTARLPGIHTVVIKPDYDVPSFEFDPATCTITRNDSVVWINEDTGGQAPYILTSDDGLWQPANIQFGSEFTYTFNSTGTYQYGCEYFPHMIGTIIVK